jgi:hypothetical protein
MAMLLPVGCTKTPRSPELRVVPMRSFAVEWEAPLNLQSDRIRSLHVVDDKLFAVTEKNASYVLSSASGRIDAVHNVTKSRLNIHPPMMDADKIVYLTHESVEVFDKLGRRIDSYNLPQSARGGGILIGSMLYVGLDYPDAGRVSAIDLSKTYSRIIWQFMALGAGVSSTPGYYQGTLFAAGQNGLVYAVNESGLAVWSAPFRANGGVVAPVKADDAGVYVSSTDRILYCLDRSSGRIKWRYFADQPLTESAILSGNTVYQIVPNVGLVAIERLQGNLNRTPKWMVRGVTRWLSEDAQNVYALAADGFMVALDKETGAPAFRSGSGAATVFATNTRDGTIFAATRDGRVLGIRPVLTPGTIARPYAAAGR